MTVEEIRSNIRYNEDLIDQYNQEKRDLEKQIGELDLLRAKYSGLQSKFGERQQQRQEKLSSFLYSGLQNQILNKYYNGMNGLLSGSDFNNVYDGLSEAKGKINRRIDRLDQQLSDCLESISYRRGRRDYWRSQLSEALAEVTE